jgi:CBS domain-containing protein
MASNPRWRHSLSGWKELLDRWITRPTPEHMLDFGIFQGLRALHGDQILERQLHLHIQSTVRRTTLFFPCLARHALRFPPPFTAFGRLRVESSGERRGTIDIKKAGLFALTVGVSLLALENGVTGGSTWEKLEQLGERGVLAPGDRAVIEEAFTFLVGLRLQWQLRCLAAGAKPNDHIDPLALSGPERSGLCRALKGINFFRRLLTNHYQLNFISR